MKPAVEGQPFEYEHLTVSCENTVAVVTLNRQRALNALNSVLLREFFSTFATLDADEETAVIIVTGAGERAFSAGADIKEMARLQDEGKPPQTSGYADAFWALADSRKPTIGALNGLCYGGGAVLAAALDIRIGCHRTAFKFLGAIYGRVNSTWLLPPLVGVSSAKDLLFTGRVVEADEAHRLGLLNHLVEPDRVLPLAMELAQMIAGNDQRIVRGAKRLLHQTHGTAWQQTFENERRAQEGNLTGTPVREAFADFLARKADK